MLAGGPDDHGERLPACSGPCCGRCGHASPRFGVDAARVVNAVGSDTTDVGLPSAVILPEYVDGLRAAGVRVFRGTRGSHWVRSMERVLHRLPTLELGVPDPEEVDEALTATDALIASYVTEPTDGARPANAWLYVCTDRDYSRQPRSPVMRRN